MNPAHFHLLVNHFPIIGTIFGLIVLLAGFLLKKDDFKIAAYGLFIITALLAIPSYLSGEPAEEVVERVLSPAAEPFIESHEEIASVAIWLIEALGLLAVLALVFALQRRSIHKVLSVVTLLMALVVAGVMAKVNNTGGEIRHEEIRGNAQPVLQDTHGAEDTD